MAAESPTHTLNATALVHEAYLRLVGAEDAARWQGRGHFFAAAERGVVRQLPRPASMNRVRASQVLGEATTTGASAPSIISISTSTTDRVGSGGTSNFTFGKCDV